MNIDVLLIVLIVLYIVTNLVNIICDYMTAREILRNINLTDKIIDSLITRVNLLEMKMKGKSD